MSKERIYIVEDEQIIALDLQRRLERLGYIVCGSAASGEEALAGIRKTLPDLILMDIMIHGSLDGISVAIELKKDLNIPVIFLSAYTDNKTLDRAKEVSPLGYILKPFKERELATMLEMALFKSIADTLIRKKEQLFSTILNSTTDAILVIDLKNTIVFLNTEAEQIFERTYEDSKNLKPDELFTLSDMETGELFQIPRFSDQLKVLKARNLRLTNGKNTSFVVEMTVTRELSASEADENYIISFKDISRLHEMTDTLKYQTSHDSLTDLLNRSELALRINSILSKIGQQPMQVSALFIDIDYFKIINDSCGTQAGDVLIKETAARINYHMSGQDFAARIGGDDFVLIHFDDDATTIAKNLVSETQAHPFKWNNKEYPITLSVAIVPLNSVFVNEHDLMITGNQTVMNIHESGGNRYSVFSQSDSINKNTISISEWISKIHQALLNDRFALYYQPIEPLDPANSQPKLEVLLRMIAEDGSIIPPSEFIPIAERYSIIPAIDRWVVNKSMEIFAQLQKAKNPLANSIFCINLSGASLADESIIGYIIDSAEKYQVPPQHLCLEVTESSAIFNLSSASRFIRILKERGFSFALDDFGSGFSSFNYLKNLPIDYVKIDGCFIRNIDHDPVDFVMVQAITSMCRILGLRTIGEFAETQGIIEKLREIGVDYAQGYGISKPLPFAPCY